MRSVAREVAFKKIFECLFDEHASNDNIANFFDIDCLNEQVDKDFVIDLVNYYLDNKENVNDIINKNLVGYDPTRIYRVDRAIISLAVTEIKYYKQTPLAVVINEAVEIAKKYGTEKSYSFVNGILKTISKEI